MIKETPSRSTTKLCKVLSDRGSDTRISDRDDLKRYNWSGGQLGSHTRVRQPSIREPILRGPSLV